MGNGDRGLWGGEKAVEKKRPTKGKGAELRDRHDMSLSVHSLSKGFRQGLVE